MDTTAANQKYFTAAEVAEMLRCSPSHISNLIKARKLGAVYAGHRTLVPEAALNDFIERGKVAPQEAVAA